MERTSLLELPAVFAAPQPDSGARWLLGVDGGATKTVAAVLDLERQTIHLGHGGPSNDTGVTGTAADNVKAAVKAKYPNVTVTSVRKDPDGSYDAFGTDANGNPVFYDVSANLKTITANAGHGAHGAMPAPGTAAPTG